jgi:hypothetical protein
MHNISKWRRRETICAAKSRAFRHRYKRCRSPTRMLEAKHEACQFHNSRWRSKWEKSSSDPGKLYKFFFIVEIKRWDVCLSMREKINMSTYIRNTAEKRLRMRQHYWNLYCERDVKCSECCQKLKMEATSMFCFLYENASGIMNVAT